MSVTQERVTAQIGNRVRAARAQRGWTLDELAARSAVSRRLLVQIEHADANPSLGTLLKLAGALDVTLTDLVSEAAEDRAGRSRNGTGCDDAVVDAGRERRASPCQSRSDRAVVLDARTRRSAQQRTAPPRIARVAHRPVRHGHSRCRRPPRRDARWRQCLVRCDMAPRVRQRGIDRRDLHPGSGRPRLTAPPACKQEQSCLGSDKPQQSAAAGGNRSQSGLSDRPQ